MINIGCSDSYITYFERNHILPANNSWYNICQLSRYNYTSTIIEEIQYLFQDDKDLEIIQLGLLELPFVDIDDAKLHYTLFHTEEFHKFRIYRLTKESIIIGMAQGNLQAA